jgi:hypothetical protein
MNVYELLSLIIQGLIAVGALIFGTFQVKINKRLKNLQDYVAISAVPDPRINKIKLLNTGKINLYLWGFDMLDNKPRFKKPRLMAAGTGDAAYYWIDPPQLSKAQDRNSHEFEFTLYLKDEFNKEWISEHGGRADKVQIEENGVKKEVFEIKVWSYKNYKKKWSVSFQKEVGGQSLD